MAAVKQLESGYWQARIRRKGQPLQSRTFPTKSLAEAWARQVESQIERGAFIPTARAEAKLFKDLAQDFAKAMNAAVARFAQKVAQKVTTVPLPEKEAVVQGSKDKP